jgi:hypothetical protein
MAKGSLTYYFDGVQVGAPITYTKFTNQAPKPNASTPWSFGIIDQQHLVLRGRQRLQQKHPEVRHEVGRYAVVRVVQQNSHLIKSPLPIASSWRPLASLPA